MWCANVLLIAPAALRSAAAKLFAQASGNPADSAPESFSVEVVEVGGADVLYFACHTRIRAATLAALPQLAKALPGALWLVTAHDDDDAEAAAKRLSVDAWLATQGLEILHPKQEETK